MGNNVCGGVSARDGRDDPESDATDGAEVGYVTDDDAASEPATDDGAEGTTEGVAEGVEGAAFCADSGCRPMRGSRLSLYVTPRCDQSRSVTG